MRGLSREKKGVAICLQFRFPAKKLRSTSKGIFIVHLSELSIGKSIIMLTLNLMKGFA